MSSKEIRVKKAESKLRNYIQKKYGKIDYGMVSEGVSQAWLKKFGKNFLKKK
tara:strand:+ start:113 stop:268 length:156 start_codon:yes stop_codon:yes gene_type:complete